AMGRNFRLTITSLTYILMFYAAGKESPADFLQKQEMWPGGNSLPPRSGRGDVLGAVLGPGQAPPPFAASGEG
ncbi:MAG TPA: hypothetical protein VF213_04310, partial [Dongiaceae bacterium]